GIHISDGALDVVGVDAAVLVVAHVLAFKVDLTVEHAELLGHGFLLVGMAWITSQQVGQLDGDDLQLDVTVVGADPFDAGVEVVGGRVAGLGSGLDHAQDVGAADPVLARRLRELDVLHISILSDRIDRLPVAW
ncbi:MAG: hypothetical protein ACRDTT_25305, partial [Pseudonocardiaceae bacterium]